MKEKERERKNEKDSEDARDPVSRKTIHNVV